MTTVRVVPRPRIRPRARSSRSPVPFPRARARATVGAAPRRNLGTGTHPPVTTRPSPPSSTSRHPFRHCLWIASKSPVVTRHAVPIASPPASCPPPPIDSTRLDSTRLDSIDSTRLDSIDSTRLDSIDSIDSIDRLDSIDRRTSPIDAWTDATPPRGRPRPGAGARERGARCARSSRRSSVASRRSSVVASSRRRVVASSRRRRPPFVRSLVRAPAGRDGTGLEDDDG
jgi:hypothetical protein